jgi:hypothetical protein
LNSQLQDRPMNESSNVLAAANSEHTNARWQAVEQALLDHHHNPDLQGARALCAAIAAHKLVDPPVWPMLVGPPGSMKTHLLSAFDGLPHFHMIDTLTPQTFISGQITEPSKQNTLPAGLLQRIGAQGLILYSDFSTVLAMKHESKASILADMRRIYDGQLHKEFGTADKLDQRKWQGRITFVVAVTPAIDAYYSIFQTLGERFVLIRWPRAGGTEAALVAMDQQTEQAKDDLKQAIHSLIENLAAIEPQLSTAIKHRIAALTEITVRGRTHVPRFGRTKEIIYEPEPESATRLAQQLAQLSKGSALISGREVVSDEDYQLVRRVALDCIPPVRRKILETLISGGNTKDTRIPASTLSYAVEDLEMQGLLEDRRLSSSAVELLKQSGILPDGWGEKPPVATCQTLPQLAPPTSKVA